MAAPIAHIFLATHMLAGPFTGLFKKTDFIVGTSFPDIRYLQVAKQSETRVHAITIE